MTFDNSIKTCLSKSFTFAGRASRSEYWYFALFVSLLVLIGVLLAIACGTYYDLQAIACGIYSGSAMAILVVVGLCYLCLLPASISVTVRRFHDINRSGWNYWWAIIPYIGGFIVLFFMVQPSKKGENQYGCIPE